MDIRLQQLIRQGTYVALKKDGNGNLNLRADQLMRYYLLKDGNRFCAIKKGPPQETLSIETILAGIINVMQWYKVNIGQMCPACSDRWVIKCESRRKVQFR